MFAARHHHRQPVSLPSPLRRRSEPKSLALLVDVILARYGILPLETKDQPAPVRRAPLRSSRQTLLFPVG